VALHLAQSVAILHHSNDKVFLRLAASAARAPLRSASPDAGLQREGDRQYASTAGCGAGVQE